MKQGFKLVLAIIICQLAGFIGSLFTMPAIAGWYSQLNKPSFNPPNWLFGPAWLTLYTLMGISAYLIWRRGIAKKEVKTALIIFGVQLILNSLWSIIFFGLKLPWLAFAEISLLWIFILLTILKFLKISQPAGLLLLPYLAWVSFASLLNFSIARLN